MSIELVLIPVAIAATQTIASHFDKKESVNAYSITTIMKDEEIIKWALDNYGCNTKLLGDNVLSSDIGDVKILFSQDSNGVFKATFDNDIPLEAAEEFIGHLQEEYTSFVQQDTYRKLLERAKEQGLVLETEEVNENNSIVLNFTVRVTEG